MRDDAHIDSREGGRPDDRDAERREARVEAPAAGEEAKSPEPAAHGPDTPGTSEEPPRPETPSEPSASASPGTGATGPALEQPNPEVPTLFRGGTPELREKVVEVLKTVYDPEIPVDVYELGLIYEVDLTEPGYASLRMTLTAPGCPVAGPLVQEIEGRLMTVPGIAAAQADLVWDPPWSMDRMSEAARLQLGFF